MSGEKKLILFFDKGVIKLGFKLNENYGRPLIITEDNQEKFINRTQIAYEFDLKSDISQETLKKIRELEKDVDLETIWEISISCPDVKELSIEEISNTLFQKVSTETTCAVLLKLHSEENLYFKKKGEKWEIRPEEDVEKIKKEKETIEENKKRLEKIKEWFEKNLKADEISSIKNKGLAEYFSENHPRFPGEIPELVRDFLLKVKDDFINERKEEIKKLPDVLLRDLIPLKEEDIFKLLCFLGVLDPFHNIFAERFGINHSEKQKEREEKISVYPTFKREIEEGKRMKVSAESYSLDIEGTEIRDDAVSSPKIDGENVEVFIHIADVTLLDSDEIINEVIKRGKTIYFPEGKIDMLPQTVIRELSLDANQPKPAITFKINFKVTEEKVEINSVDVMRSEVNIIKNYEFSAENEELEPIKRLGLKIYDIRTKKMGGLDLISEDFVILLDGKKFITKRWKVTDLRIALSEFMMLCSYAIAFFCKENKIPIFYRESKIEEQTKKMISDINSSQLLDKFSLPRPFILWKNIRSARTLITQTEPTGAQTIGYPLYAWGTSPLRRGWDFINIIQIGRFLKGEQTLSKEELNKIKEKLELNISKAETAEDMRYKFILYAYILKNLSDKNIDAIVVEKESKWKTKRYTLWVDEVLSFIRSESEKDMDILSSVKINLIPNPLKLSLKAQIL
jgi:exoribonuclease-2